MAQSGNSTQTRRDFLANAVIATGAALAAGSLQAMAQITAIPTADASPNKAAWKRTWDAALAILAGNIHTVPNYARPLLFEGSTYQGIWQECGPHEGLVYATLAKYVPAGKRYAHAGCPQQSHGLL